MRHSLCVSTLVLCYFLILLFIFLFQFSVGCQGNISKVFHQILDFYFSLISINKNYFDGCSCGLQKQHVYQMCFILCCISYISSKLYQCWYQKNSVVFNIFCEVNIMYQFAFSVVHVVFFIICNVLGWLGWIQSSKFQEKAVSSRFL